MESSLAANTRKLYSRIWSEFRNFCASHLQVQDAIIPVSISTLSLFLASLFMKGYAPSTLFTYNSAVSYMHKLNGLPDPGSSVFIQKMLQGAKKSRIQVDNRLPITKSILYRLVLALNKTCSLPYYQSLYKAMFVTAFFGLLRVGEITKNLNDKESHCLQLSDIKMQDQGFFNSFSVVQALSSWTS